MSEPAQLIPEAERALQFPRDEKIAFALSDQWIGYTEAHRALDQLSALLNHPPSSRMPNLLLVGRPGNGKTTVIRKFRKQHGVMQGPEGEAVAPVVVMEMPTQPDESRFWTELLLALSVGHRDTDPIQRKKNQALSVLRYVNCRMLVIDEVHNVLIGHIRQQRHFLAVLKNLSNELKLPIVAVGTREAIRTLHTDPQLSSRFEVFGLPLWRLDKEFLILLASIEKMLPLPRSSELTSRQMASKLYDMSGGTIGSLTNILKRACVHAIQQGEERISLETLDKIQWVKLDEYRTQADAL